MVVGLLGVIPALMFFLNIFLNEPTIFVYVTLFIEFEGDIDSALLSAISK